MNFAKYLLLGVNKKATNAAVRGELGQFPVAITLLTRASKYWSRFDPSIKSDTLCLYCLPRLS